MLEKFYSSPAQNWKSKDAAIYLVTSLATRAKTAKHGITQTNQVSRLSLFPHLCKPHKNLAALGFKPLTF